jgi:acyl-CoA thioester hydrolase
MTTTHRVLHKAALSTPFALPPSLTEDLSSYFFHTRIPLLWGHIDAYNHLNNVQYIRVLEEARIHLFGAIGDHTDKADKAVFDAFINGKGVGPILGSINCKFIRPVTYPDTLSVFISVPAEDLTPTSHFFNINSKIVSENMKVVVAASESKIVLVDYTKSPPKRAPWPAPLLKAARKMAGLKDAI